MYQLFLKIATRYLLKNKLYSSINIIGLAIGIASFVLIMLYVNHEYSYDTFEGSENVHRVYMDYQEGGEWVPGDANAYIVSGPTLKEEFAEITDFVRLRHLNDVVILSGNQVYENHTGSLADPSYFEIFKQRLSAGDVVQALNEPYSVVLKESLAKKLFGTEQAMGKTLKFINSQSPAFTVTGILADDGRNSHIKNDFLISFQTFHTWPIFEGDWQYTWNQNIYFTYIQLAQTANAEALKNKVMDYKVESLPYERHNIEPIEDIHLYSDKPYEAEANGSASRVRFLLAIAFIIIVLSWLNYINLSTAKSLERAKETGIRKVSGALRPQIVVQSLLESLLLNMVALAIAALLVFALLPIFNGFIGKELTIGLASSKDVLPFIGFILLGTLLSGLYPAFVLSGYNPVKALKGKVRTSSGSLNLRKGLIIGQFLVTIILLVGTLVVSKQITFLQDQPIGADIEQVIALSGQVMGQKPDSIIQNEIQTLQRELTNFPFVESSALAKTYPGDAYEKLNSNVGIVFPDGTRDDSRIWYNYSVGPEYFELMDMQFLAGGPFLETATGQSNHVVMNERFLKHMGIQNAEEAINKTIQFFDQDWTIAGVIKDYHHFGLKTRIEPILLLHRTNTSNILIKLKQQSQSASGLTTALTQIEQVWKDRFPQSTLNFTFLDEKFEAQYHEDQIFGVAFQVFTVLAILIASMGLFGLTSYTVVQRKKEIGIHKVNGATITEVLALLNKDFVKGVLVAFVMAIPISWYAMNQWLQGFAYKTTLSWWVFVLAGAVTLLIALGTVSWQSFKAAMANPVDSLRAE